MTDKRIREPAWCRFSRPPAPMWSLRGSGSWFAWHRYRCWSSCQTRWANVASGTIVRWRSTILASLSPSGMSAGVWQCGAARNHPDPGRVGQVVAIHPRHTWARGSVGYGSSRGFLGGDSLIAPPSRGEWDSVPATGGAHGGSVSPGAVSPPCGVTPMAAQPRVGLESPPNTSDGWGRCVRPTPGRAPGPARYGYHGAPPVPRWPLADELGERAQHRVSTSPKLSGLPNGQALSNSDFTLQPATKRARIKTRAPCTWCQRGDSTDPGGQVRADPPGRYLLRQGGKTIFRSCSCTTRN